MLYVFRSEFSYLLLVCYHFFYYAKLPNYQIFRYFKLKLTYQSIIRAPKARENFVLLFGIFLSSYEKNMDFLEKKPLLQRIIYAKYPLIVSKFGQKFNLFCQKFSQSTISKKSISNRNRNQPWCAAIYFSTFHSLKKWANLKYCNSFALFPQIFDTDYT